LEVIVTAASETFNPTTNHRVTIKVSPDRLLKRKTSSFEIAKMAMPLNPFGFLRNIAT
jgi:hypothetical protein